MKIQIIVILITLIIIEAGYVDNGFSIEDANHSNILITLIIIEAGYVDNGFSIVHVSSGSHRVL